MGYLQPEFGFLFVRHRVMNLGGSAEVFYMNFLTKERASLTATGLSVSPAGADRRSIETRPFPKLSHVLPPISTCRLSHLCRLLPPASVRSIATYRGFTFYVTDPISSVRRRTPMD